MPDFVSEPSFWVCTVCGSILLNILGNLLTPYVPKWFRFFMMLISGQSKRMKLEIINSARAIHGKEIKQISIFLRVILHIVCGVQGLLLFRMVKPLMNTSWIVFITMLMFAFLTLNLIFRGIMRYYILNVVEAREVFELEFIKNSLKEVTPEEVGLHLEKFDADYLGETNISQSLK